MSSRKVILLKERTGVLKLRWLIDRLLMKIGCFLVFDYCFCVSFTFYYISYPKTNTSKHVDRNIIAMVSE